MRLDDLMDFAEAYAGLGNAVQDQLKDLIDDPHADCNSNAVELMKDRLGGMSDELDEAIKDWEEAQEENDDEDEEE